MEASPLADLVLDLASRGLLPLVNFALLVWCCLRLDALEDRE